MSSTRSVNSESVNSESVNSESVNSESAKRGLAKGESAKRELPKSGLAKGTGQPSSGASRRSFLVASSAGAAVAGVAAALPVRQPATDKPLKMPAGAQSLVAHVTDPVDGTISLFVGDREVIVHDVDLVTRLMIAAGSAVGAAGASRSASKGA